MNKPKRQSDYIGRKVRLLTDLESHGGSIFPAGTIMEVRGVRPFLSLEYVEACQQCKLKYRHVITRVSWAYLELVGEE